MKTQNLLIDDPDLNSFGYLSRQFNKLNSIPLLARRILNNRARQTSSSSHLLLTHSNTQQLPKDYSWEYSTLLNFIINYLLSPPVSSLALK
jgi:hypothetical protein